MCSVGLIAMCEWKPMDANLQEHELLMLRSFAALASSPTSATFCRQHLTATVAQVNSQIGPQLLSVG